MTPGSAHTSATCQCNDAIIAQSNSGDLCSAPMASRIATQFPYPRAWIGTNQKKKPTRTPADNAARIRPIGRSNTVKPVTTAIQGAHSHVHQQLECS